MVGARTGRKATEALTKGMQIFHRPTFAASLFSFEQLSQYLVTTWI
jgi:hypothetical protein